MTRRTTILTILQSLGLLVGVLLPFGVTTAARPCEALPLYDEERASEILATQRPFIPTNRDLFFTWEREEWADTPPIQEGRGPALSEDETYGELRALLNKRFPCSPQRVLDGLSVYGNHVARQKVPDPTLRAALAALTGTLGEPAINYLLYTGPVTTIHFGVAIYREEGWPTGWPAYTNTMTDGTDTIVFDGRYRFNSFATFSALLFHEALHVETAASRGEGDLSGGAGYAEETAALSLETLVYMQMLLADPAIARLPDGLTRGGGNNQALDRLNSGKAGTDRLNIFVPGNDVTIDPVSTVPLTQFADYYALGYDRPDIAEWRERETGGNALLTAVLRSLAEPGHDPPTRPDFDLETLEFIDQNHAVLSSGQLLAVACTLELDVPCD